MVNRAKYFLYRNSLRLAVGIIVGSFLLIIFMGAFTLGHVKQELSTQQQELSTMQSLLGQMKSLTEQLKTNSGLTASQVAGLNQHMDCIVQFFSQPDRSQKAITDINRCELNTTVTNNSGTTSNGAVTDIQIPVPKNSSVPLPSNTPTTSSGHTPNDHAAPQSNPSVIERLLHPVKNLINDL